MEQMTQAQTILPFKAALDGLCAKDSDFAGARAKWGDPPDRFMAQNYASLARIILGQQISRAVATTLWSRLEDRGWVDAPALASLDYVDLQHLGISGRKSEYLIDLARAVVTGALNIHALADKSGEAVQEELVSFRGIGAWTADNYRLFALADMDAWPGNDLALQEGLKRLKGLEKRPSHAEMNKAAEAWRPYRGAAALMLWHIYAKLVREASPSAI
ncbi:MAG: DNA-3-methyladenine glycosylase family protein [Candidatus Puniceispirillaceae bacterium]